MFTSSPTSLAKTYKQVDHYIKTAFQHPVLARYGPTIKTTRMIKIKPWKLPSGVLHMAREHVTVVTRSEDDMFRFPCPNM
ncbi:hypothetical protein FKM82_007247 [Ascaphus truei]